MTRLRKAGASARRIWIVLHCEVALGTEGWNVSEEPFFAASSRHAARRLIRTHRVEPGSWWRVESARLDDVEGTRAEDQPDTLFYSAAGRLIPSPDLKAGYRSALRREKRAARMIERRLGAWEREGRPEAALRTLKDSLRSLRRILSRHR